jgi:hypothetical protein
MKLDKETRTYDCEPILTDLQVLEFCKQGFLMLEGVVPDEINRRTFAYLDAHRSHEPSTILLEDWFVNNVLLQPQAAGAVRSVLGKNVGLPVLMSNHRVECPASAQGWHHDADSLFGPEVNYLQVFYYPQDVPTKMGPTEVLPGSHLTPTQRDPAWQGGVLTAVSAGSVFITIYPILHRRSASTAEGMRNLLKWNYWRTEPPQRNWIIEPDFDFHTANYGGHGVAKHVAHMLYWLCGKADEFRTIGGQGWPYSGSQTNQIGKSYGFPSSPPRW